MRTKTDFAKTPIWGVLPVLIGMLLPHAVTYGGEIQRLDKGDLVAICGDSITEQRLYSLMIADYLMMCPPDLRN